MKGSTITKVFAYEGYSNRGQACVVAHVETANGAVGIGAYSSGLSVGPYEAPFLYDGDDRFDGKGMRKAVANVNNILGPALIGKDASLQADCDSLILEFGKKEMGANATASLSTAILHAGALSQGIPLYRHIGGVRGFTLPLPSHNAATGSVRYGGPVSAGHKPTYSFVAYGFEDYDEAAYSLWELTMDWGGVLTERLGIKMQIENGFAIPKNKLKDDFELWEMMADLIHKKGDDGKIGLQVDMGANGFYDLEKRTYKGLFDCRERSRDELIALVCKMPDEYPFVVIEDPLMADDFEGFATITEETGIQIVGDDLFASNPERLRKGIEMHAGNCILVSVSQIGSVSEAFEVALLAHENDFATTVSESRGEETDICDYAVGLNCSTIREGGLSFTGNRLMSIHDDVGKRMKFFGKEGLKGSRFAMR